MTCSSATHPSKMVRAAACAAKLVAGYLYRIGNNNRITTRPDFFSGTFRRFSYLALDSLSSQALFIFFINVLKLSMTFCSSVDFGRLLLD